MDTCVAVPSIPLAWSASAHGTSSINYMDPSVSDMQLQDANYKLLASWRRCDEFPDWKDVKGFSPEVCQLWNHLANV